MRKPGGNRRLASGRSPGRPGGGVPGLLALLIAGLTAAPVVAQRPPVPTPQSGFSAWSPDGSLVAVALAIGGPWQLYLIDPFTRERRRLTRSGGNDISPTWSADGRRIVFVSDRSGNMELYSIGVDGADERRLTETPGSEMAPNLGPDGRLTWAWTAETDQSRLGQASRVMYAPLDRLEAPVPWFESGVQHYPVWSPDGAALSFSGNTGEAGYGVWVKEAEQPPIRVSGERTAYNSSWRPDGSSLVFVSPVDRVARIFEVERDGTGLRQLSKNTEPWFEPRVGPQGGILVRVGSGASHRGIAILSPDGAYSGMLVEPGAAPVITSAPQWAPDGGHLVFVSDRDGYPQIWRMNPDGGAQVRLSNGIATERNPTYSPDGRTLAFVSIESGKAEVWIMKPDGSGRLQVTHESGPATQARWSRDGKWIYYRAGGDEPLFLRIRPDGSGRELVRRPEWPEIYLVPNPVDDRVMTSGILPGTRVNQVLVRASIGAEPKNVSNREAPSYNPDWSPDGEWITFVSPVGQDAHAAIFVVRADGSGLRQLTDFPEGSYQPRWSPDGRSIAFRRGWTAHVGLYRIDRDGANLLQLTNRDR